MSTEISQLFKNAYDASGYGSLYPIIPNPPGGVYFHNKTGKAYTIIKTTTNYVWLKDEDGNEIEFDDFYNLIQRGVLIDAVQKIKQDLNTLIED